MQLAEMNDYFRELCGGVSQEDVSKRTLTVHLQAGLDELAGVFDIGRETDDTGLSLVVDQYEYAMPADVRRVTWAQWNDRPLALASVEEWKTRGLDWRGAESAAAPQELAVDGRVFLLYPPPDADAITTASSVTYRYERGWTLSPAGVLGLPSADVRLAVAYAAYGWMGANNADGRHDKRLQNVQAQIARRLPEAQFRAQQTLQDYHPTIGCWTSNAGMAR